MPGAVADPSAGSGAVRLVLEVRGFDQVRTVDLQGTKVALGKAAGNDVVIDGDPAVSRVHLLLEAVGGAWTVHDVGSRNGTFLNGQRLASTRVLRPGDVIQIGATRIVFGSVPAPTDAYETVPTIAAPSLTRREQDCLAALCAPIVRGSIVSEPASVRDMAAALVVSESAIKKLLARLYDKFGLHDLARRRGALAVEALRRGAVALDDAR